ncbi:MAG TPA: ATP-binding protein [Phenylobacterium sp.]|uniref:ATP-binding protein n=1 Tax=Phenylobacterium sp. TaxID=1871053 RepID=UPI002B85CAB8|nr:ATP-binding protein [Phenylobacterium sp.]HSV04669.1 ATP-binding protein [Phenylobacterium sp.]
MAPIWERLSRPVTRTPRVAIGVSIALLVASLALGVMSQNARRAETLDQAQVQANILAGSLAAPLAFNDVGSAREYLNALGANPAVEAAGAYDLSGRRVASFRRVGDGPPPTNTVGALSATSGELTLRKAVRQGTTGLGSIYLRIRVESLLHRELRYLGIGIVVIMASLLIAALGASHASLTEAHRKLQEQIEEREKAEEALRQAQKMEAMGQLTGGVAHDFNNLLMVASSGLDLMDRTSDPIRRDRLAQGIRQAIDRGADLTQQLLAFSRKSPQKTEVVDLPELLAGMRDVLNRSLREDIDVEISSADDLWPVEVDPSQLEVAILNIAINARDAMPNGGAIAIGLANVAASEAQPADMVQITVADTGHGMPPELLGRAFEPFFTTKGVGQGTGLGLSQVYGFARTSGGDVKIESEMGQGAKVTLRLPRSHKAAVERRAPRRRSQPTTADRKARILLVEDDERVAELVTEMLLELGYQVTRAPTAATALDALRLEHAFDLVFSDMVMPGDMSGLDLARKILRERPDVPVVLTTGYSSSAAEAATEGMRLLLKPYRLDTLAAELRAALSDTTHRSSATH